MRAAPITSTYEFTPEQNGLLAGLVFRMRSVGGALLLLSGLLAARAILGEASGDVLAMAAAIAFAVIGLWSIRAAAALRRITKTEGADLAHLMRALGALQSLYEVQLWVFLASGLLLAASLLGWVPSAW